MIITCILQNRFTSNPSLYQTPRDTDLPCSLVITVAIAGDNLRFPLIVSNIASRQLNAVLFSGESIEM